MTAALFVFGTCIGGILLALLLATVTSSAFRIWPTPGAKTWQSYVFWPLFRSLNVLCFAVAVVDWGTPYLALPFWLRLLGAIALAASLAVFLYSFFALGRDNSYGAQEGLVTGGIYQWTRNPQNAMLIVVYGALAVTADSGPTYVLAAAMMAVYALMVLCEEPWLRSVYGARYDAYCAAVPRFFKWRRLWQTIVGDAQG